MNKQKVCIVGGGLTGLLTSVVLSKCNLNIDLFAENFNRPYKNPRTTAFSYSNYQFLKNLNILSMKPNESWPISEIKIYNNINKNKPEEILKFKENNNNKKILYMVSNINFVTALKSKIKLSKKITIKTKFLDKKKLNNYNLIVNCTGGHSDFTKNIRDNKFIKHTYDQKSFILNIKHDSLKNNIARQFFLPEGPLALLPINKNQTSIVWSVKKKYLLNSTNQTKMFIRKKINELLSYYLKPKSFSNLEIVNLNFQTPRNYFIKRFLNFGDALHIIHPFAGQGFNMTIRDVVILKKIITEKIQLGLDIGDESTLQELSGEIKSKNYIYSTSIDILNKFFSIEKGPIKSLRDIIIKKIDQNIILKNFFINFADKGLNL